MPKLTNKLSYKEERFIFLYLVKYKGDGLKAAFEAYDCKNEAVAGAIASEYLNKPRIKAEIEKLRAVLPENMTEEAIAFNIGKMAFLSNNENIRTKNSETLAKWKAMLTEKSQVETSEKEYRAGDLGKVGTNDLLSELTERLKLSNQGIDTSKPKAKLDEKPVSEPKNES